MAADKPRVMNWTIQKKLAAAFAVIFVALGVAGTTSALVMWRGANEMTRISQQYLPEARLATAFESEILNARIFFIYHVTIQKPGALNSGWEHFKQVQELMPQLTAQVAASSQDELRYERHQKDENFRRIRRPESHHRDRGFH